MGADRCAAGLQVDVRGLRANEGIFRKGLDALPRREGRLTLIGQHNGNERAFLLPANIEMRNDERIRRGIVARAVPAHATAGQHSMRPNKSFVTKTADFFLDVQNSRFEVGDHRIVDRRMGESLADFFLEDPLSLFEYRNVGLQHDASPTSLRLSGKSVNESLTWLRAPGCSKWATM